MVNEIFQALSRRRRSLVCKAKLLFYFFKYTMKLGMMLWCCPCIFWNNENTRLHFDTQCKRKSQEAHEKFSLLFFDAPLLNLNYWKFFSFFSFLGSYWVVTTWHLTKHQIRKRNIYLPKLENSFVSIRKWKANYQW